MQNNKNNFQYVGLWQRFWASNIDASILIIVRELLIKLPILLNTFFEVDVKLAQDVMGTFWVALVIFYFICFESSAKQATPGKRLMGLAVVDLNGDTISFGRATLRTFSLVLSFVTFPIGFLLIVFTSKKQALHDIVAGCIVVKKGDSYLWLVLILLLSLYSIVIVWTIVPSIPKLNLIKPPEKRFVSLTKEDYENILSTNKIDFESGVKTSIGPAAIKIADISTIDRSSTLQLDVRLVPIPNIIKDKNILISIDINHIYNKKGVDLYNWIDQKKSHNAFFIQQRVTPFPHIFIRKYIYLDVPLIKNDLSAIDGDILLHLPEKIQTVTFDFLNAQNNEETVSDSTIRLLSFNGHEVVFEYTGPVENFIDSIAYSSSGKIVEGNLTWNQVGNAMHLKFTFTKDIQKIKMFIASTIINLKLNFKLDFAEEMNPRD